MRNLVLVHLESLNSITCHLHKGACPTLREWEGKSLSFSRYFSTATSTLMVVSDLVYGGLLQYEPCENMRSVPDAYCCQSSLLDDLKKDGYRVRAVNYPAAPGSDVPKANERHFVGFDIAMECMDSYEAYMQALDEAMTAEAPFAVLACNYIGNIGYYGYMQHTAEQSGFELWESACVQRDQCVKDLLDILKRKGLTDNTTIIFYGDHGDDICAHGRHKGLLHVFEPYASLIHTPFWIYDSRIRPGETDRLCDTTDIRSMVERLLHTPETGEGKLKVEELGLPDRKYSLSRSGYAAQKVRERSFHKGYGVTDGTFLFLAGDQGMELYHIWMDEGCQHNLLDYFDFSEGALRRNRGACNGIGYHIKAVLDEKALQQTEAVFYAFRKELMRGVEELYRYADSPYFALEIDCENIHYGWEERERRTKVEALWRSGTVSDPEGRQEFDLYGRYLNGKKIVVYGAGDYGTYFCEEMAGSTDILAWVDKNYGELPPRHGTEIQSPEKLKELSFDAVFIAIANIWVKQEVKDMLSGWGIPGEKIF